MERGSIWWADLPAPVGSEPGYRRPVLIVQSNVFNRSRIQTIMAVVITSNLRLGQAPGNVIISAGESGLPKDSVINVSQVITLDRTFLTEHVSTIRPETLLRVEEGLRLVLDL